MTQNVTKRRTQEELEKQEKREEIVYNFKMCAIICLIAMVLMCIVATVYGDRAEEERQRTEAMYEEMRTHICVIIDE